MDHFSGSSAGEISASFTSTVSITESAQAIVDAASEVVPELPDVDISPVLDVHNYTPVPMYKGGMFEDERPWDN